MDNNIPGRKRQTSPLRALRPYEQASMLAVAHIEETLETPDNIENCEEWVDIVESLGKAALNGREALEKEKIILCKAVPEFAAAYALYTPVPAAPSDQEDDRRVQTCSETGVKTFRVSKIADLRKAKRAHWLVNGILLERTINLLVGDAGVGKTFITLDIFLHLMIGRDWKGHAIRSKVKGLYIYGEGETALVDRVSAWQKHYGCTDEELDNASFLPFPVQLAGESDLLTRTIEQIGDVSIVVIDTFSMCAAGIEENNNTAVAQWMNVAHEIKNKYGCAVYILHHVGKAGGDYRGASSMKGNVDSMVVASVEEDGTTILVECRKQRDKEAFKPFYLERHTVEVGLDEETLEQLTSCVVLAVDKEAMFKEKASSEQLVLMAHIAANPGISDIKLKTFAQLHDISKQKCDKRKDYMVKEGLVEIKEGQRKTQGAYLTEKGQNVLSAAVIDGEDV
jgi:AAA domain